MRNFTAILIVMIMLSIHQQNRSVTPRIIRSIPSDAEIELQRFMNGVAVRESNNNHRVTNRYGMLGKYQFNPSTIRGLGFNVSNEEFLNNPKLQDSVMITYLRDNNRTLLPIITRYEGKVFKGVAITRAGVLAAAHLAGAGGVKNYFASDDLDGRRDGNGTSVRDYITHFNNYPLRGTF